MSGLFGGGKPNTQTQEIYAGIQVSSSVLGQPLPYVAGRQRIPFNLSWYGNFQVLTSNSGGGKGGGGSSTKQYSYSTAFIAALCLGPITGIFQIWHDKALETLTSENLAIAYGGAVFKGSISGTTLTTSGPVQGFITNGVLTGNGVFLPTTITGQLTGPAGGAGTYTVSHSQSVALTAMFVAQPAWSGFPAGTPANQIIPYDHLAYVASSAYNLGSSAGMPNLSFEVEGIVPGFSDANSIFDADPSAVMPNYLLDGVVGALANYPGTPLIVGSTDAPLTGVTNSYQSYCLAMGLLTSPYEYNQRQATDFTAELLQCTNSDVFLSYGTLKVFPYCDQAVSATVAGTLYSYTPNLTPLYILGDDDYVVDAGDPQPPVKLHITAKSDTYNTVNVQIQDRVNGYNAAPVNCSDDDDIARFGPRLASSLNWRQITVPAIGKTAGNLWLQKQLREVNRYEFKTRRDYSLAEPGIDFVALNTSQTIPGRGLGLVNQLCQIESVEVSDQDETLSFMVREIPGVTRSTAQFNWASAQGYFANYAVDPGPVQTPLIFQMPPLPAALTGGITLGIAVCGQTANAAWLGCYVFASVDGGTTYQYVGTVPEACRYGKITANLPNVADPDTTSTLSIALANTNLQLSTAVTHAEADSMQTPILLYGGTAAEVMSFGTAALVSAGNYNLTYLRRGLYGSTRQTHSSTNEGGSGVAANFVRLDGALFQLPIDPGMAGQTILFKFVSFNTFQNNGPQNLAGATAYSYLVANYAIGLGQSIGSPLTLIGRGVGVNGNDAFKSATTTAWDSDVYSLQGYTNGAFVSWQAGQTNLAFFVGLGTNPTLDSSYTSINYGMQISEIDTIKVYELGTGGITVGGAYAVGDTFAITYDGSFIRYLWNGAVLRQIPAPPNLTLYLDSSFFHSQAVATNLQFGPYGTATPVLYVPVGNCLVSDENVTKQGGSGAWDSGVYSINGYQTCHVVWKANDTGTSNFMVGLAQNPILPAVNNYLGIDFAFYCDLGTLFIFESGTAITTIGPYVATDLLAITYDGSTIRYWQNGIAHPHTVAIAGKTYYGVSAMFAPGSALNSLEFGPGALIPFKDSSQISPNAATISVIANNASGSGGTLTGLSGLQNSGFVINPSGPAFNCTAIVTATIGVQQTAGTLGDVKVLVRFADDSSTFVSATQEVPINSTNLQTYTLQWEFTHSAANAGLGKVAIFFDVGSTSDAWAWNTASLQIEYLIR